MSETPGTGAPPADSRADAGEKTITVIVTAHSRDEYLMGALESVVHQSLPRSQFEVILVRNFVGTGISGFCAQQGIRELQVDAPIGPVMSSALREARGRIITFLDDDDLWLPDRLQHVAELLERFPSIGYYHNQARVIDARGRPVAYRRNVDVSHRASTDRTLHFGRLEVDHRLEKLLDASAEFNASSIAVRRELALRHLSDLERLVGGVDSFLFFVACLSGMEVYSDSRPLTCYRLSDKNISWHSTATGRADPIARQLTTIRMLLRLAEAQHDGIGSAVADVLRLIAAEYETMLAVFGAHASRKLVLRRLARMLRVRGARNALKSRVLALGATAALLSPGAARWLYFLWDRRTRPSGSAP